MAARDGSSCCAPPGRRLGGRLARPEKLEVLFAAGQAVER